MQIQLILSFSVLCALLSTISELRGELAIHPIYTMQPRWTQELDLPSIEQELQEGDVASMKPMSIVLSEMGKKVDFDNEVFLVELRSGLKGVFKSGDDRFAEVAAYRADQYLGQRLAPPTVFRT